MTEANYSHLIGALAALASALCWAIAALMFARIGRQLSAKAMNAGKGIIALICLAILIMPTRFQELTQTGLLFLALSGLLGITLGDTLYFLTLKRLGARLTLLVGTLIPVFTAISAVILFNETLTFPAATGLLLTIGGVTYVLWEKSRSSVENEMLSLQAETNQTHRLAGVLIAMLFVVSESGGILLTKAGVENLDSLEATFIRQIFGIAGLFFWGMAAGNLLFDFKPVKQDTGLALNFILTSIIGAFLGTWLSVLALKMTHASVAVALNSTSPLFVIPVAIWIFREKVQSNMIYAAFVAVTGIMLYFLSME